MECDHTAYSFMVMAYDMTICFLILCVERDMIHSMKEYWMIAVWIYTGRMYVYHHDADVIKSNDMSVNFYATTTCVGMANSSNEHH